MNPGLAALSHFVCLECGDPLTTRTQGSGGGKALLCPRCGSAWPFVGGIPRFVGADNYADSFGHQWNIHRRTQLDSHTGLPLSRSRLFGVTRWPEDLRGQSILEAGSGAGRFTEILVRTGARVFSFDSSAAVEANFANNGAASNLCLFQGDISRIPLPPASFDKVLCLGVLQHTPDPRAAFQSLAACVKPGGELVVDIYAKRITAILSWKYVLRPLTKRADHRRLYRLVERAVDILLPVARRARRVGGRVGARLLPIVEYSHLGLPEALNRDWAVLDTFDMYAPEHDHPQTLQAVRGWYRDLGWVDVEVSPGPNGVIGRGRRPVAGDVSA